MVKTRIIMTKRKGGYTMKGYEVGERQLIDAIKMLAPGTPLREGIENLLRAKTGALIVISGSEKMADIVDGGFPINMEFTPNYLYELGKMDGAIILSQDAKKILNANVQLVPDISVTSSETGIRHRIAERVAKQTGEIVISISQRRNIITLYLGNYKYVVQETNKLLSKANQAIQTLEKYKTVLDRVKTNLSALEFEDLVTVYDVATVIQRTEMVMRIVNEIERFINELGNEGRLISMQLEELVVNVKDDGRNIIADYIVDDTKEIYTVLKEIRSLTSEELLNLTYIGKILGFTQNANPLDLYVIPRGYRILSKIPRLPVTIIDNLILEFGNFQKVLKATIDQLDDVDGIGEIRARYIKEGLRRLQEQVLMGRHI